MNRPSDKLDAEELQGQVDHCMLQDRRRIRRRLRRLKGRRDRAVVAMGLGKIAGLIGHSRQRADSRRESLPEIPRREDLPIEGVRDELARTIEAHQVTIVQGETGSGKTTRLGQICLSIGRGVFGGIAHTQPRRIAARSVARRIASELGQGGGGLVGHHVRFDRSGNDDELLTVMTDGVLLASIRSDPRLERWDTIILDEAHERSINIDFLIGVLRRLLPRRPELRVIVTSATIDAERFAQAFGGAPVVTIPGRTHPVEILHEPPATPIDDGNADALARAVVSAVGLAEKKTGAAGDMLVFLPGEGEIRTCMRRLNGAVGRTFDVLPLYARLSASAQDQVMQPGHRRRIICATNVAETSLTVPRIRAVIDSGLARVSRFSARRQVQRLPLEGIARDSAEQRAGRAGRVAPGVCIRLWSEADHAERAEALDPELRRSDLAGVLLRMADLDLGRPLEFPFIDPPKAAMVRAGERVLEELGALSKGALTSVGRRMATLPVAPRVGRMLLAGQDSGCLESVRIIAAGLSIPDPRLRPHGQEAEAQAAHEPFVDRTSDFLTVLNLWHAIAGRIRDEGSASARRWCVANHLSWVRIVEWRDLVHQLRRAMRSPGGGVREGGPSAVSIHRALLTGLLMQVGHRTDEGDYAAPGGRRFHLHPGSAVKVKSPNWVMVGELVETRRLFGRVCASISPHWLEKAASHLIEYRYERTRWDADKGEATVARRSLLRGLTVTTGHRVPLASVEPGSARRRFIDHGLVDGDCALPDLRFIDENTRLQQRLQQRSDRLRRHDLLVGPSGRGAFFDDVVPEWVHSPQTLRQWVAGDDAAAAALRLTERDLLTPEGRAVGDAFDAHFPDRMECGAGSVPVIYRHRPGEEDDGLSLRVGIEHLHDIDEHLLAWLVPPWRRQLVETLLRGLPKAQRRAFAPMRDSVAAIVEALPAHPDGPLAVAIEAAAPVPVSADALGQVDLPIWLVPRFEVLQAGQVIATGRDLSRLRRDLAGRRDRAVERLLRSDPRHGLEVHTWPDEAELSGTVRSGRLDARLVLDRFDGGVRLWLEPDARLAAHRHRLGVRALLVSSVGDALESAVRSTADHHSAMLCAAALGLGDRFESAAAAMAVELAMPDMPPHDRASFEAAQQAIWNEMVPVCTQAMSVLAGHLQALLRCRDEVDAADLAQPDRLELEALLRWLGQSSVPTDLPRAWWPLPSIWADTAAGRAARGDPDGARMRAGIGAWLERLGQLGDRADHPVAVQFRLLVESMRAQCHRADAAGVRVDETLLAQQWTLVESLG